MNAKTPLRFAAIAFVTLAIAAALLQLGRKEEGRGPASPVSEIGSAGADPLHAELVRCRDLGEAVVHDAACRRVWAESRRRFLTPGEPSVGRRGAE